VLRIQPEPEIFFNCINKRPGWKQDNIAPVHLEMNYERAFPGSYNAAAYERMLLNAASGDQSLFVGSEELVEAWRIFTPLLDDIDNNQREPVVYPFGVRAPDGFAKFASERGIDCEDASGHYYLPKYIRDIEVLVPEGDNIWRADNSKLGSHNGGLAYRKSAVFDDLIGHNYYLTYGEKTQGIDVGNDFVKVNVNYKPGMLDPHCLSTPSPRKSGRVDASSPMSGYKTDNATRRMSALPLTLPFTGDGSKVPKEVDLFKAKLMEAEMPCGFTLPPKCDAFKAKVGARDETPPRTWRKLKKNDSI
jgi:hypothetical protein